MQFTIPKIAVVLIVLAVLGVVAAAIAIPLTNAPTFCASCHTIKPSYDSWFTSTHKEVTCVACHVRPTFEGFVQDKVIKGTHDVWVTLLGIPKKPDDLHAKVYSEVCLACHRNMLRISEVATRDLPGPLKKAGLIMEHRKHMSRLCRARQTVQRVSERHSPWPHQDGSAPGGGEGRAGGLHGEGASDDGLFSMPRRKDRV